MKIRIGSLAGRVSGWIAFGCVILAPWLFAASEPWCYLIICVLLNVALIFSFINYYRHPASLRYASVWTWAYAAVLVFLLLQILPLPGPLTGIISPLAADVHKAQHEIFHACGLDIMLQEYGISNTCVPLSLSTPMTLRSLYLITAYFAVFILIASHHIGYKHLRKLGAIIVISAFIMALFSLAQHFSGTRLLYGYYNPRFKGTMFGTFTNRNHYAAFMNMAFGVALALVFSGTTWSDFRALDSAGQRTRWLLRNDGGLLLTESFMAVVIGASTLISLSRGAVLSLAAALIIVLIFSRLNLRGSHVSGHFIAILLIFTVSVVMWLGWDGILRRMGTLLHVLRDPLGNTRVRALRDTIHLFSASPFVGCGLGTFQHVFPLFNSPDINVGHWTHAHNDIAELLAEGGIVLALITLWLTIRVGYMLWVSYASADHVNRLFISGLFVGILAMLFHSALDYSLHKPANPLMFAAILGMVIGAAQFDPGSSKIRIRGLTPWKSKMRRIFSVGVICILILMSLMQLRELRGEIAYARYKQWGIAARRSQTPDELSHYIQEAALETDLVLMNGRNNPELMLELCIKNLKWLRDRRLDPEVRIKLADQALSLAALSVRAAPSNHEYWLWLARAELVGGNQQATALCLERARQVAPIKQPVYLYLAPGN